MREVMEHEMGWAPKLDKAGKPVYLAIADSIAEDIRAGILSAGTKLPPLRVLAERLGLDFTTISRAYNEAGKRGLVIGRVGQGTFVRAPTEPRPQVIDAVPAIIDMTMNAPPMPENPQLLERMRRDMADMALETSPRRFLGYGDNAGSEEDRAAGAFWLRHRLPDLAPESVIICPGAQGAMLALFSSLARPGDTILTESLTYPGMKALAAHLGLKLEGIAMDAQGLLPDAFKTACQQHAPKALYCNPTLQNPTTITLSAERRAEIVSIARQFGVAIVEDDSYGMLAENGPPPVAAFGPDITYHIAGLAKCVAPALRIAYLIAPDRRQSVRMIAALRATMLTASPISASLAARWINTGTATAALNGIRAEARARQQIAREILPASSFTSAPDAFHLWLRLPNDWSQAEFSGYLRAQRLAVAGSNAFAVTQTPPEALRICLGTLADRDETRRVLGLLADLLEQSPAWAQSVV